jgi:hypothetical protein
MSRPGSSIPFELKRGDTARPMDASLLAGFLPAERITQTEFHRLEIWVL